MHRINIAVLTLWLALAPAVAQMNSFFPGPGTVHTSGGGYVGPGDVVSGAKAWYGLRCYSAAYAGFVADIQNAAGTLGTRLQCSGGTISAVAGSTCANTSTAAGGGAFVSGGTCSPLATTCAVACFILTWYDQSGTQYCNNGSAIACDATQATQANQATFQTSGCTGLSGGSHTWCAKSTGGAIGYQSGFKIAGGDVQPITHSLVVNWNTYTSNASMMAVSGGGGEFEFLNSSPSLSINAGTGIAGGAITTGAWNSIQIVYNGASSSADINGSTTSSLNAGTQGTDNWFIFIMTDSGGFAGGGGNALEFGWWLGGFNGTQQSNMTSNQRGTANGWGF